MFGCRLQGDDGRCWRVSLKRLNRSLLWPHGLLHAQSEWRDDEGRRSVNCGRIRNKQDLIGYRRIPSSDTLSLWIINTWPLCVVWVILQRNTFTITFHLFFSSFPRMPSDNSRKTCMVLFYAVRFHVFVQTAMTTAIENKNQKFVDQEEWRSLELKTQHVLWFQCVLVDWGHKHWYLFVFCSLFLPLWSPKLSLECCLFKGAPCSFLLCWKPVVSLC